MAGEKQGGWRNAKSLAENVFSAIAPSDLKPSDPEFEADSDRIDEAVLALLVLGLHEGDRVWKTFDWEAMDRLYEKGLISRPAGRAKSVVLTETGLQEAKRLHQALFASGAAAKSKA